MEDTSKQKKYSDIINHFDTLENSYYSETKTEKKKKLPFKTEYIGLQTGKIRDIELINNEKIKLTISTEHEYYSFTLNTSKKYNTDVEFVRFLLFYDIDIQTPSDLIGKNVTLREDSSGWNLYVPNSISKKEKLRFNIDKFARYFGYHQFSKRNIYELILGGFVLFSVSVTFSTIVFYLYQFINAEVSMNIYLYLIILFPFISSILYRLYKIKG